MPTTNQHGPPSLTPVVEWEKVYSLTEAIEEPCKSFIDFFRSTGFALWCPRLHLCFPLTLTPSLPVWRLLYISLRCRRAMWRKSFRKMTSHTFTQDPLPTALFRSHIPTLSPFNSNVVNLSLHSGCVPPALKDAVICPLLRKPTLDPEVISPTLPSCHKVLEKVVAS